MANYHGKARSNYFRVVNPALFLEAVKNCEVRVIGKMDGMPKIMAWDPDERVALISECESGWASSFWNPKIDDDEEIDIYGIVSKHPNPEDVAVLLDIGSEKMAYLHGCAVAVNSEGRSFQLRLSDIYGMPEVKALGTNITQARG